MRVWHFVKEDYGLQNLQCRRLKIATLNELNDPFEFFNVNLSDKNLRDKYINLKDKFAKSNGLLCFSKNWHNPVQWSHYAANHTGLCLGFDVPNADLLDVNYSPKRPIINTERFQYPCELNLKTIRKFINTKYSHWQYENEVRCIVQLKDKFSEKNLYFSEFSKKLCIAAVIVGARSDATRKKIEDCISNIDLPVDVFKARLAFKSFRIVRQRNF